METFNSQAANVKDIIAAGEFIFSRVYYLSFKALDIGRYFRLKQSLARHNLNTTSNLALLPPTAKMHSFSVYLQVQICGWENHWTHLTGAGIQLLET